MSAQPRILVTNDDGIHSPGLAAAVDAVRSLGLVTVAAPAEQQSAMGRSLCGDRQGSLHAVPFPNDVPAYACPASPAQTVLMAMTTLFAKQRPDLIVSGINYGENLGMNLTLSGTVGAAIEAAAFGIPALAMSLQTKPEFHFRHGEEDWTATQSFTEFFAKRILRDGLPEHVDLLNVNVPSGCSPRTPWRVATVSRQSYFTARLEAPAAGSRIADLRMGMFVDREQVEPGSDIDVILNHREVSVSPVTLDMTAHHEFAKLKQWQRHGAD